VGNGQVPGITVRLSNQTDTANDYQGPTTVEANTTLALAAADQVPNGTGKGNVSVAGSFNLGGFSETINGLSGSGSVDGGSGTPTLTLGDGDVGDLSGDQRLHGHGAIGLDLPVAVDDVGKRPISRRLDRHDRGRTRRPGLLLARGQRERAQRGGAARSR
jgi:hypothetical protein